MDVGTFISASLYLKPDRTIASSD